MLISKRWNKPHLDFDHVFFFSDFQEMLSSYPGYICVGQPQDPLPVGSVDEETIWLCDGSDVGTQRGVRSVGNWDQVGAQLPFPASLSVWDIHTPALVTVRAGAVNGARRRRDMKH